MKHEMPVVPAELKEPLIRFLSDREGRIEFPPHMFSMLKALGEEIALAVLTAGPPNVLRYREPEVQNG
ncbi:MULTISPECIES: hypothetical protein [Pantoea]|uniref:hypothetical protein n=1 Tax=Pantoea TaxID=53335 RepID=UPI00257BC52A|nr:hypothetical protein [Pantoea sp. UBA5960]